MNIRLILYSFSPIIHDLKKKILYIYSIESTLDHVCIPYFHHVENRLI